MLFAVLLDQPVSFFDDTLSGEIINRMAADTEVLQKFVSFALPQLIHSIILILTCFVVMMFIDWRLTLIFWSSLPAILILFGFESAALKKAKKLYQELLARAGAMLSETVLQIRTVRAFAAEGRTQLLFMDTLNAAYAVGKRILGVRIIFELFIHVCFQATYILFFYCAIERIIEGAVTLEIVTILLLYVMQVCSRARSWFW